MSQAVTCPVCGAAPVMELGESWWIGDKWVFVPQLCLYSPAPNAGYRIQEMDVQIPPANPR